MPGTDFYNGATSTSRMAEFSGGATGGALSGSTGANYVVKQTPPLAMNAYRPSSVLSPMGGSGNGMSANTFQTNRELQYYRS